MSVERYKISKNAVDENAIATGAVKVAEVAENSVKQSELATEEVTVTISAGASSGTATVTAGSIILGYYPISANATDQHVKSISISDTTLTLTLSGNSTNEVKYKVVLLKA